MSETTYNELNAKIKIIIEYLESHGGADYEVYTMECVMSHEEISFDIIDIAMDIRKEIDCLYNQNSEQLPF